MSEGNEGPGGELVPIAPRASNDRVLRRVADAGHVLREASSDRLIDAIAGAAATLVDPGTTLGLEARRVLPARSGLDATNVELGLSTTLACLSKDSLSRAQAELARVHRARAMPVGLAGFVLASNVFTAALRPIAWSLLTRVPLVIKPGSEDEGLAELFALALAERDPELGDALGLLRFGRNEPEMFAALASRCDVVHAWGSDRSVGEIRAALPASTSFVAHGHGLGAAYVPASAFASAADVDRIAERLALDVALYDQRGCLSPHFVLVERGGPTSALDFARVVAEHALAARERAMPRGRLPPAIGAAQLQWRGVGAVRGELFEGSCWSVTYEGDAPPRLSPGWRNLAVYACAGAAELFARLTPFGVHLKALGVAASHAERAALAAALPPSLAPRISAIGTMQTPDLLASADGEPPWIGFVRAVDVD